MQLFRIVREAPTDYTNRVQLDAETGGGDTPAEPTATDDTSVNTADATTEDGATDYTVDEAEIDPDGPDEGGDPADTEPEDYTNAAEDDGSADTDDSDLSEGGTEEPAEEEPNDTENENNRILLDDMINLYYTINSTVDRLVDVSRDNIVTNKIINQVSHNCRMLAKVIYDYIVFKFSKNKYVHNVYKYNYFLQAFKINVEMLKKIQVFDVN